MKKVFSVNSIIYTVLKGRKVSPVDQSVEEILIVLHKIGCCAGVYRNIVRNWDYDQIHTMKDFKMVCDHQEDWDSADGNECTETGETLSEWLLHHEW